MCYNVTVLHLRIPTGSLRFRQSTILFGLWDFFLPSFEAFETASEVGCKLSFVSVQSDSRISYGIDNDVLCDCSVLR